MCDAAGRLIHAWGDVDRRVFPRSAIKPLQALPLLESGAAERFDVSDAEIALACASHGGEPVHVDGVAAWLARLGLDHAALECGAHMPMTAAAAETLIRASQAPGTVHNNCSGKHTGMLATALQCGDPLSGYVGLDHPVQQRVRAALEDMTDTDLGAAAAGIDGCSIPTIAEPLSALAVGMARLADPAGLGATRAAACRRITAAMAAYPVNVAGTGRFCTAVIEAAGTAALIKTGAEGVYCAALVELGLGLALKIDDGATRAAEVATAAILDRLGAFDDTARERIAPLARPVLRNRKALAVGMIRPAEGWL